MVRVSERRLAVALVVLLLLSACKVRLDVATDVEDDGSGEMAVTVMLSETARETLRNEGLVSEDPQELAELREQGKAVVGKGPNPVDQLERGAPRGWRVERVEEGTLEGVRLRAAFDSLDEIPTLAASLSGWGDDVAALAGGTAEELGVGPLMQGLAIERDGPLFHLRGEPSGEAYEGADGGANRPDAELIVSVDLPGGVREHNADEEDGGTLYWVIPPGHSRSISATSDLTYDPSDIPLLPAALGGSVVAAALVAGWWMWRRRRGAPDEDDGAPPEDVFVEAAVPV